MASQENLFLVHSFPTNSILLDGLIRYLGDFFTVYPIDLPGFIRGNWDKLPEEISLHAFYNYVESEIEGTIATERLQHYLVAGISFGFQVVNNVPHDDRCKGIIAMEPYLGMRSVKRSRISKLLATVVVKAICASELSQAICASGLSQAIWNSRLFKAFLSRGSPPDRVRTVLEQINARAFFGTLNALLDDDSEISFQRVPYILVANPDDTTIDYKYMRKVFDQGAKPLLVEKTNIPHYPQQITEEYFRENIPGDLMGRIIVFVSEHWDQTRRRRIGKRKVEEMLREAADYHQTVDLSGRILDRLSFSPKEDCDFANAKLSRASLRGVVLDDCCLDAADLEGADLGPALGTPPASLWRAKLQKALLQGARLRQSVLRGACLKEANLTGADLREADLQEASLVDARLNEADLTDADLRRADLTKAELRGADLSGVNLESATLSHTRLERDSLGRHLLQEQDRNYEGARTIYLTLKRNFAEIGDYGAASWAYVRERIMYRHTFWLPYVLESRFKCGDPGAGSGRRSLAASMKYYLRYGWKWFSPRHEGKWMVPYALKWAYSFAVGTLTGYGEQPWNAIYLAVSAIVIHALLYMACDGIRTSDGGMPVLGDYFVYSLGAFCTMTFDNLQAITPLARVLTSLEAIAGVTALAVFTAALSQRIGSR